MAFAQRLRAGDEFIPLAELAALFGGDDELQQRAATRGDIRFFDGKFINDGPELIVKAGVVELEIPNLVRGTYETGADTFRLSFPNAEFTLRACVKIAILRKCFDLQQMRADSTSLELDFGSEIASRRYEF